MVVNYKILEYDFERFLVVINKYVCNYEIVRDGKIWEFISIIDFLLNAKN